MLFHFLIAPAATSFVLMTPFGRTSETGIASGYRSAWHDQAQIWEGPHSFDLSQVVFLWSMPSSPISQDGLGGGITWAMHPNFCPGLLPHFPEANSWPSFLECSDLRHAITNAFNTVGASSTRKCLSIPMATSVDPGWGATLAQWAMNHEKIRFRDVTELCAGMNSSSSHCVAAELVVQAYVGISASMQERTKYAKALEV